ncbi:MAG TPA: FtsW/RodA/SpoVE family cell cycle protein, partial [Candidatus Latescibacteria bacterium]|nr:FtsW/RodA/SpoVE family cell cycle protein [Candidatus Latescibacterota bacterium]
DRVRKYFPYFAFASFSLLLLPALFSVAYKGARSWVNLLGLTLQPSEIVKFALILYLADRLTKHQERLESLKDGVLPLIGLICIPLGIIVLEPDVGTAVAMAAVFGVMMFVANIRMRHILPLMGAVALAVYVLIIIEPYRLKRLEAGYQIQQGFVAMGSGGLLGRGLGRSIQKYFFLPEPYTDSILPIIGEEFGFIGTVAVVLLFCLFGWRGLRIAYQQPTLFRFLLATGLTANILMYALLNMGVMTALMPTTGLPLPFISYGGSSLVLNLAGTGLLLNLSRQRRLREGEEEVKEDTE